MMKTKFQPCGSPDRLERKHRGWCRKWPIAAVVFACLAILPGQTARTSLAQAENDDDCLFCHASETLYLTMPSGEALSLALDVDSMTQSAHGLSGVRCADCHPDHKGYPHPPQTSATIRDYQLSHYVSCRSCHSDQYEAQLDSIHQRALAGGRPDAAICTDCHDAHAPQPPGASPEGIPQTCGRCHAAIYYQYRESVHGAALEDHNADVPTCIDCHGVHNIADPLKSGFRLTSPEICADCHADPARMAPYGISTQVVETYVADFHGTTVTLFGSQSSDQVVSQAVCIDCHGIHDIKTVDDPASPVIRKNLLATCQQCHPNAGEHFTEAWASHYIPSLEHNALVYNVDIFYAMLLGTAGLLFALAVSIDPLAWLWKSLRRRSGGDTTGNP